MIAPHTPGHEFSAKNVDAAIEEGLRALGLGRDQVKVEVISKGSRGILGIGSEAARVRLIPVESAGSRPAVTTSSRRSGPKAPGGDETEGLHPRSWPDAGEEIPAPQLEKEEEVSPTRIGDERDDGGNHEVGDKLGQAYADDEYEDEEYEDEEYEDEEYEDEEYEDDDEYEHDDEEEYDDDDEYEEDVDGDWADEPGVGSVPARERAPGTRPQAGSGELERLAVELLDTLLGHMKVNATIESNWVAGDDDRPVLVLDIEGQETGHLIGRHGKTVASLQYLLRLMINQQLRQWPNVVVDVGHYKAQRSDRLTQLALRMAQQVVESSRPVHLEPMPPGDRRLIHLALRDHQHVYTKSVGEGDRRKVQILMKS